MNIKVVYSLERDVWNYLNSLHDFKWLSYGREDIRNRILSSLPKGFKDALKKAANKDDARKIIKEFLWLHRH